MHETTTARANLQNCTHHGQVEDAPNRPQSACFFHQGPSLLRLGGIQLQDSGVNTGMKPAAQFPGLVACGDATARGQDQFLGASVHQPLGQFQAKATGATSDDVGLVWVAGNACNGWHGDGIGLHDLLGFLLFTNLQ